MINLELIYTSSFSNMLGGKKKCGSEGGWGGGVVLFMNNNDGCQYHSENHFHCRLFCFMIFRQLLASGFGLCSSGSSLHQGV